MDCLASIVGIIETPTVDLPNITSSDSGFWLEDTSTGRIPVKAAFYNDTTRINGIISDAVREALKEVRMSAEERLLKLYTNVNSTIGFARDWTSYLPDTTDFYYIWLDPKDIKGSILRLKNIAIHTINGLHDGNVYVYKGDTILYDDPITDFEDLTIDLDDTVFIAYQGDQPRDFKYNACCGKRATCTSYVDVGSGTVDALANLPINRDELPESVYCNGIELECTFDCDPFSFLCGYDFVRSNFGQVFAKLVQQIARKNIAYWLLTNNKITAYAVCKEEDIRDILTYLIDDITTMVTWLPENYDHSDCYSCNGIAKDSILI